MMTTQPKTPKASPRPALVVAGMHRSGTSAMARVLSLAGAALPERVIQPGPDNPLGFWEPWEMVALNDDILKAVGSAWDDLFVHDASARAWQRRDAFLAATETFLDQNYADCALPVIKDPRSSVLARLWRQALENRGRAPVYVIMVRHPLEVAGSLRSRDGFPIEKGLLLWAAYMMAVERDTRECSRVFVSYEALLHDWRGALDRVEHALGTPLPARAASASKIDAFLSRSHRHHEADGRNLADQGGPAVPALYDWLQAAAAGVEPAPSKMDAAAEEMQAQARLWRPIFEDHDRIAVDRLKAADRLIAETQARLLREGARVTEMVVAEAAYRAAAAASLNTSIERATAAEEALAVVSLRESTALADLRAVRLDVVRLQTNLGALIDQRAADAERALQADERERELTKRIGQLDQRNAAIKSSLSWKLTRPVRAIQKRFGRGGRTPTP